MNVNGITKFNHCHPVTANDLSTYPGKNKVVKNQFSKTTLMFKFVFNYGFTKIPITSNL